MTNFVCIRRQESPSGITTGVLNTVAVKEAAYPYFPVRDALLTARSTTYMDEAGVRI